MNIADYGGLGHGEVVGVDIPKSQVKGFADQYFSLFKDSDRPDKVLLIFLIIVDHDDRSLQEQVTSRVSKTSVIFGPTTVKQLDRRNRDDQRIFNVMSFP